MGHTGEFNASAEYKLMRSRQRCAFLISDTLVHIDSILSLLYSYTYSSSPDMSDFASMLKGLEATAKRAAQEPTPSVRHKKRPRSPPPSRDVDQLSIDLAFMCIGAQKAGTTWLHEMLKRSGAVGLPCNTKEIHFWDWHRRKGLAWYSRQFNASTDNKLLGEITPCYMALPERHVKEIHSLFPHLKVIFLARDLVDRTYSAITMELRNQAKGLRPGEFDSSQMDAATKRRLQEESEKYDDDYFLAKLNSRTHMDRSDYAAALEKWLTYFDKSQILVLPFTDVAERPKELLNKILQHIGADACRHELTDQDLGAKVNAGISDDIRPSLRRKMETALRPRAVAFNQLLRKYWPEVTWELNEYPKQESSHRVKK